MLTIALISPKGMGMGDVKLSFVLGLYLGWLGWGELAVGFFLSFLLGAVIGVTLIATKIGAARTPSPSGPFLAAGTSSPCWSATPSCGGTPGPDPRIRKSTTSGIRSLNLSRFCKSLFPPLCMST